MPEKFLDGADFDRNQLINLVLQLIAGDHGNPTEGLIWYDSTAKQLAFYNGTAVRRVPLTGGGGDAATLGGSDGAFYRNRANHTGTQLASTVSNFDERVMSLTAGYIDSAELEARVNALIAGAPGLLDTLDELAAAIGDDANFAATIQNQLNARTRKFPTLIGDGAATSFPINHNLGTRDVQVSSYFNSSPFGRCHLSVEHTTINQVTVRTGNTVLAAGAVRVVVVG